MRFFNLFNRRKETSTEYSKGGSRIYQYDQVGERAFQVGEPTPYAAEIDAYMERCFPGRTTTVFHELISDQIHLDVYFMKSTKKEDFSVLYTSGMSALPMTLPEDLLPKYQCLERAELMMLLPHDWDACSKSPELYWPVGLIKFLARFPHEYHTWLGWGHTIPNGGEEYLPYDSSTKLNGCILSVLGEEYAILKTEDGTEINFYVVVPLYKDEMMYKLEYGAEHLLQKLNQIPGYGVVISPNRTNVCTLPVNNKQKQKEFFP